MRLGAATSSIVYALAARWLWRAGEMAAGLAIWLWAAGLLARLPGFPHEEKWEVLLEIRLLGQQGKTSVNNMFSRISLTVYATRVVEKNIVECRPPLGALPRSLTHAL